MKRQFRLKNVAMAAGAASCSASLLAHPGATEHPLAVGPVHALAHSPAGWAAAAAVSLAAVGIWLARRARPGGAATEQE